MSSKQSKRGGNTSWASSLLIVYLFLGLTLAAILVWMLWSILNPASNYQPFPVDQTNQKVDGGVFDHLTSDLEERSFYNDPLLSYTIGDPVHEWDDKRRVWLKQHPSVAGETSDKVVIVTASQPGPCKNPIGDHLMLRSFKNKVDYTRFHGYDIFYNNALLNPKMYGFWAKLPVLKATMLAHPEADWLWWVDANAVFTDMEYKLPLEKYKDYNFVVHGWTGLVRDMKSWSSLNTGVFLIRNCQWSIDFIEAWARMAPQVPADAHQSHEDLSALDHDDQSGLIYLISEDGGNWGTKIFIEGEFYLQSYWVEMVGRLANFTQARVKAERNKRRHAEKDVGVVGSDDIGGLSAPIMIHFTGCEPCSGYHNQRYVGKTCWEGMDRVLTIADNQVLKNYGYVHPNVSDSTSVFPYLGSLEKVNDTMVRQKR